MISLAPFDSADYALRAQAHNDSWPGVIFTPEEMEADDEAWPDDAARALYTILDDGQPVGFAAWMETFWRKAEGRCQVACAFKGGSGPWREAYELVLAEVMEKSPREILGHSRSDFPARTDALSSLGFVEFERSPATRLELDSFDPAPFLPHPEFLASHGLTAMTMAEAAAKGIEWTHPLHRASNAMVVGIPTEMAMTEMDYDTFVKEFCNEKTSDCSLMLGFWHEGEIVAFTVVRIPRTAPQQAATGFTGVVPEWRRRGLATAIKAVSLAGVKERGVRWIITDNLDNNPMLQINQELGFKPWFDIISLVKRPA